MKRISIYRLLYRIDNYFGKAIMNFCAHARFLLLSFLFILFFCDEVFSQSQDSTQGTFALSAQIHFGYLVPHRPSMIGLVTGHTKGFELDLIKSSDGSKTFERAFHYPELGISYCYFDIGNPEVLGRAQAIYPFADFPVSRKRNFQFNLRLGAGLGWIQKPFDHYENFKNNAIGSHLNGVMSLRAELQQKICNRSKISFALGITHWSNGSAKVPNLGINVCTMSLAYQHFFGERKKISHENLPPLKKKFRTTFYAAAFHKEIIPVDGRKYFVATMYGNIVKVLNHKSNLGGGFDLFYNDAIIESLRRQEKKSKSTDAMRGGVHLSYMLSLSDFDIVIENGVYLFGKLDGDTFLYTRLGMREKITKHLFLCVNLKTHFAKADFFEFGIGYEF